MCAIPRRSHARQRPSERRDKPAAIEGERSRQASLRVALLALAVARAGSEGISREQLAALPELQSLYNASQPARDAMFRRDMIVLTGQPFRAQHRHALETSVTPDEESNVIEPPVLYDAALGRYRLRASSAGPLRLAAEALEALCILARALWGGASLPGGRELFTQLAEALGDEDRQKLEAALQREGDTSRAGITLDLGLRETMGGLERVLGILMRAWRERQTVKFTYRAKGGLTEHYEDQVQEIWLGDHAYVGVWKEGWISDVDLRIDRIVPETLALAPRRARERTRRGMLIRYRLDAAVARGDVTERLEGQTVQWEEDGSAVIAGHARSLFWARRLLLSYGGNAQALEPPALVAEMRREAEQMRDLYISPEHKGTVEKKV